MGAAKFGVVIYGNTLDGTGAHPFSRFRSLFVIYRLL